MPRCDRQSVELRGYLDLADKAGVQRAKVFGGDPVLQDGLAAYLVDFRSCPGKTGGPGNESRSPAPDCRTFQSRAIMVAYSSLSTG